MSMFTLTISCLITSNLPWFMDLFQVPNSRNIPGSYAILFFTASNFTSIPRHIHNYTLFSLWLHLFILSGVISLLFPSSILSTYWPGNILALRTPWIVWKIKGLTGGIICFIVNLTDCQCRKHRRHSFLDQENPLEAETATHSSILAWKFPWTELLDELQSTGLPTARNNWAHMHIK